MKLIKILAASALTLTSLSAPALASTKYQFNKYVGDVYVNWVEIYKNTSGGTTAEVNMSTPICNGNFSLAGYVEVKYRSPKGGYFTRQITPRGNDSGSWYASADVDLTTDGGRVYISDATYCIADPGKTIDNLPIDNTPFDPGTWNPGSWF